MRVPAPMEAKRPLALTEAHPSSIEAETNRLEIMDFNSMEINTVEINGMETKSMETNNMEANNMETNLVLESLRDGVEHWICLMLERCTCSMQILIARLWGHDLDSELIITGAHMNQISSPRGMPPTESK